MSRDFNKILQDVLDKALNRERRIEELNRQYDKLEKEYMDSVEPIREELSRLGNGLRFKDAKHFITSEIADHLAPEIAAIEKLLAEQAVSKKSTPEGIQ